MVQVKEWGTYRLSDGAEDDNTHRHDNTHAPHHMRTENTKNRSEREKRLFSVKCVMFYSNNAATRQTRVMVDHRNAVTTGIGSADSVVLPLGAGGGGLSFPVECVCDAMCDAMEEGVHPLTTQKE
jgi:hypothetical protein